MQGSSPYGADTEAEMPPLGAVVARRYRIERLLGRGGFGSVFAATDAHDGTRVALKMLSRVALELAGGEQRMRRETELASRLRHPNSVRVLGAGMDEGGAFYIAFELLDGRTVEDEIVRLGPLPPRRVAHIAVEVLAALEEAHAASVIHRDLKPANVFLLAGYAPERVKILDFGIAKSTNPGTLAGLTQEGQALGTPAYMSPEQAQGGEVGPASDLFALGIVLAEMLLGRPLYGASSSVLDILRERLGGQPLPIPEALRAAPLGAVVVRATQHDPAQRYRSAAEMRDAVVAASAGLPSDAWMVAGQPTAFPASGSAAFAMTHGVPATHLTGAPFLAPPPHANLPPSWSHSPFLAAPPPPPAASSSRIWVIVGLLIGVPIVLVVVAAGLLAYGLSSRDGGTAKGPSGPAPRQPPQPPDPPAQTAPESAAVRVSRCEGASAVTQPALQSQLRALGWEVTGTLLHCAGDMVNFRCGGPEGHGFTATRGGAKGSAATVRLRSGSDLDALVKGEQNLSGERTIAHDAGAALRIEMPRAEADRLIARVCR